MTSKFLNATIQTKEKEKNRLSIADLCYFYSQFPLQEAYSMIFKKYVVRIIFIFISLVHSKAFSQIQSKDWLINPKSYNAEVVEEGDEIQLTNSLIKRTFRIAPNAATVAFDNLVTGQSLFRGVKPEAIVKINDVNYNVGGLMGQPNYAFLKKEWINDLEADPTSLQYVGHEISEPKAPFGWKQVRHHSKYADWPPKGVHLRFDFQLPNPDKMLENEDAILPSEFGREQLWIRDFQKLEEDWTLKTSNLHNRSSFQNEGKIGEIYTPQNTAVFVEKPLDEDARIVEATFTVGTDNSDDYGPGIALVWPEKTMKLYLQPGGTTNKHGKAFFGLWDGNRHYPAPNGQGEFDTTKAWTLRFRMTDEQLYCEAKPEGGDWMTIRILDALESMPHSVRIGKTNREGEAIDQTDNPGEIVRLRVLNFATYGSFTQAGENSLQANEVKVSVHYELYDGIPVMAKWLTVKNNSGEAIIVDDFTSEILAAVEYESKIYNGDYGVNPPNIHVQTDYAFGSMSVDEANQHAVHWETDPDFKTQVSYARKSPSLLKVSPEIGPGQHLPAGDSFQTFRTFVMPFDSYDRERNGLALRRIYRVLAPWSTENPLMMHARFADWDRVKLAIDQASEVGFEMVILTFGSGFNIEDDSNEYLEKMKKYADYAKSKGVEIGGYSLLASRSISEKDDVVMPEGMKPTFGNSPCLESEWGQEYFAKLYNFYETTGFSLLEHDGSYPGDVCASHDHPGHKGLADSRWNQYETISTFYQWCREQGIYLNIPDFYYMTGGNKCGMGYRETNWSLPRNQQLIHARQNIFDGTWEKIPSMGWMFVPLTEYHGGGAEATIEPLNEHLNHYEMMIASNLGGGVQACYRGPRLFDTEQTKSMVKGIVDWYKEHREVLEGDIIHLRRADGRDLDYWLNVNPFGEEKGMLMVFNPTKHEITKEIKVPLYYTGISEKTNVEFSDGNKRKYKLGRDYSVSIEITVAPNSYSWAIFE